MKFKKNIYKTLITLVCINFYSIVAVSQPIELIAHYPLETDLADTTQIHGDILLEGNTVPPDLPTPGLGVCENGVYIANTNGQNIMTPNLKNFDTTNFEYEVEFKPTASPTTGYSAVIIGGRLSRFIGIVLNDQNQLGIKHNNGTPAFSATTVSINDVFHTVRLSYEKGDANLYLNNDPTPIMSLTLPSLFSWQEGFEVSTTDFGAGRPLIGCIRNLKIHTSPSLWDNSSITYYPGSIISIAANNLPANADKVNSSDDFEIPASEIWAIDRVTSYGFMSSGTTTPDSFGVTIYEDDNGIPGTVVHEEQVVVSEFNNTNKPLLELANPLVLNGGKYWISIYAVYDNFVDLDTHRWNWLYSPDEIGTLSHFQDTIPLFGGSTTWGTCVDLGIPNCKSNYFTIKGTKTMIDLIFEDGFE